MIILDTNILSELMKPAPSPTVLTWIDQQESSTLYITAISIAEIFYGIYALSNGKKRTNLELAFHTAIKTAFAHRILPFDTNASYIYGKLMSDSKSKGHTMSILDGQIAAISLTSHATLATRNISDFHHCALQLINPFVTAKSQL